MGTHRIGGAAVLAGAALAGCGEDTTITVHAAGATLVAVDVGAGWEVRPAGDVELVEPDGVYRIAVTCRSDIGDTYIDVAAPGDATEYDRDCFAPPGTVEVTFDVTGDVYGMFIGYEATYGDERTVRVAPGTYDVVATHLSAAFDTDRVQIIRDVVIEGPTHVAIDVEGLGAPLAPVLLQPPDAITFQQVLGTTARGTWFQLHADEPGKVPASMLVPGDEQWIHVAKYPGFTEPRPWTRVEAMLPVGDGPVVLDLPTTDATATFTAGPPSELAWSSVEGWDHAGLWLEQDNEYGVPGWSLYATRGALERGADLSFPDPPPGWQPAWTVDVARYYRWAGLLTRARAAGGWERVSQWGGVYDPAPPPRADGPRGDQQPFLALRMMSSMRL